MRAHLPATALFATLAACAPDADTARGAWLASTLARADQSLARTRPNLLASRYARMASSPFEYYRGALAVFARDWADGQNSRSHFSSDTHVYALGDPHPENFGLMRGGDGAFSLEPNDMDAFDRMPYLWDLRRLLVGVTLGLQDANIGNPAARAAAIDAADTIVRSAVQAYVDTLRALRADGPPPRVVEPGGNPVLDDMFRRATRDLAARRELVDRTTVTDGQRRLRRGVIDPADPGNIVADLPAWAIATLPNALDSYRRSLPTAPDASYFRIVDSAREFGSGVASMPRVRVLVLVQGPSESIDDDVMLEVRETADSAGAGWQPPGVYVNSIVDRIRHATSVAWARPADTTVLGDPLWGAVEWLGLACVVRTESDAFKTVRVARWVEERGTPSALAEFAAVLARLLGRVHATPLPDDRSPAARLLAAIDTDAAGFIEEQVCSSRAYAAQTLADFDHFRAALDRRGPTLGVRPESGDMATPSLATLLGSSDPHAPAAP